MDNPNNGNRRIHPLMAVAAGAVILASGVGVAAMTGLLPIAHSNDAPPAEASATLAAAAPAAAKTTTSAAQLDRDRDAERRREHEREEIEQQRQAEYHHDHDHDHDRDHQLGYAQQQPGYAAPVQHVDPNAGVVEAITPVAERTGSDTGLGAVGGAVAGGLLGHQVGRGNGRIAATVIGALGGGVAGNAIESNVHTHTDYQVSVRMDNGSERTVTMHDQPNVGVGQHVRMDSNGIYAI